MGLSKSQKKMVAYSHYFIFVIDRVITDSGGGIGGFTLYLYVILSSQQKGSFFPGSRES